jgi:hypothetical protein
LLLVNNSPEIHPDPSAEREPGYEANGSAVVLLWLLGVAIVGVVIILITYMW